MAKRRSSGLIVEQRKPDGNSAQAPDYDESEEDQGLIACAESLIRAVHAKDASAVAKAFKEAFDVLERSPHEEYEHQDEEGSAE